MNRDLLISSGVSLILMVLFYWTSATIPTTILFVFGTIGTYLFYLLKVHNKELKSSQIVPLYLLALSVQLLHFAEEYAMDFEVKMANLLGSDPIPQDFWVLFNMVAYAVFILGGVILLKEIKSLMVIPLFFIIVGVVLNGIGHVAISLYVGGYFPGLYTALLYFIIGPILIKALLKSTGQ